MSKRNLLINPYWSPKDLGKAIPDSPHAVSVALPTWKDIIAYEENDPECTKRLRAIYPRFGLNPLVSEVAAKAIQLQGSVGFSAWPFPNKLTAEIAKRHCERKTRKSNITIIEINGLSCLLTDPQASCHAKAFWQHTGLGASSRQAAIALNKEDAPLANLGKEAKFEICLRLSEIYNCDQGLIQLHPSGMAALTTALSLIYEIRPGRATLQLGFPYVDVLKLPQVVFQGGDLLLLQEKETTSLATELDKRQPAAVIVELPSNPMLQCVDLQAVAKIAHERGIPVIADDTIGSALNIDVLPYADIVFSSLTKSFAGRGDILAGSLIVSPNSYWKSNFKEALSKASLTPLSDSDAIALEETSRDVVNRLPELNRACSALKEKLETHPMVKRVLHPGRCPNFQSLMRPEGGHGCLLSFELEGGLTKAQDFYDSVKVCKGPSLGTSFTLVCPYVMLAHYNELEWAQQCGIPAHLLRVSVGLEDPSELWTRFKKALE